MPFCRVNNSGAGGRWSADSRDYRRATGAVGSGHGPDLAASIDCGRLAAGIGLHGESGLDALAERFGTTTQDGDAIDSLSV